MRVRTAEILADCLHHCQDVPISPSSRFRVGTEHCCGCWSKAHPHLHRHYSRMSICLRRQLGAYLLARKRALVRGPPGGWIPVGYFHLLGHGLTVDPGKSRKTDATMKVWRRSTSHCWILDSQSSFYIPRFGEDDLQAHERIRCYQSVNISSRLYNTEILT